MKKTQLRWFVLVPGLATGLGWAIRGQIGGAMIAGLLVASALCVLLEPGTLPCGLIVGLGAVGFGFGGQMTTLQTAGFIKGTNLHGGTNLLLGYTGLALKGALWALFEGAALGLALTASRYRPKDVVLGAVLMAVSFYVGWALIDRPKLLYFSVDRPEVWGGLLFGGIALLAWLTVRSHTYTPLLLAVCGALAGGIGYPIAVTLCSAGMRTSPLYLNVTSHAGRWVDWWKVAEITYGSFMGAGLGIGTYLLKGTFAVRRKANETAAKARFGAWDVILGITLGVLCKAMWEWGLPWIILGLLLLSASFYAEKLAWHIGVTVTFFGAAANVVLYWQREQGIGNTAILWALAALATLVVSWKVSTWSRQTDKTVAHRAFLFVMWASVMLSYLKTFIDRAVLNPPAQAVAAAGGRWLYTVSAWGNGLVTDAFLTVVALVLTWMIYRTTRIGRSPEDIKISQVREALT